MSGEVADTVELGQGVRIPAHILKQLDGAPSEASVTQTLTEIRTDLTERLDPSEQLKATYTGLGTSFGGAGSGLYVFGATDRRFVLLDSGGRFAEVQYNAVTEIGSTGGVHKFEQRAATIRGTLRRVGLGLGGMLLVSAIRALVSDAPVIIDIGILVGYLASLAFVAWSIKQFFRNVTVHAPYEDVIIRTPSSTTTEQTVTAEADYWTETIDIDVDTARAERYVIRQWMRPEELPDNKTLKQDFEWGDLQAVGTNGQVAEPAELSTKLNQILRQHH